MHSQFLSLANGKLRENVGAKCRYRTVRDQICEWPRDRRLYGFLRFAPVDGEDKLPTTKWCVLHVHAVYNCTNSTALPVLRPS